MEQFNNSINLTFCDKISIIDDIVELGETSSHGLKLGDLTKAREKFDKTKCRMITTSKGHIMMVIKNGADIILNEYGANSDDILKEQLYFEWRKTFSIGRKVISRSNRGIDCETLCFGNEEQTPDFKNGLLSVIQFESAPCTNFIRNELPKYFGAKAQNLIVEGNSFNESGGIKFRNDEKRNINITIHLGKSITLHSRCADEIIKINLDHGDIYVLTDVYGQHELAGGILEYAIGKDEFVNKPKDSGRRLD